MRPYWPPSDTPQGESHLSWRCFSLPRIAQMSAAPCSPLDSPTALCYSIFQRSFPALCAGPRIGRAQSCREASFFTPAVSTTALPGRNQRETAHGFSLSLRVRVHRERGSRNTLSLCASLVTFSASRKSPRGATGSRLPQKSCPERHPAVSPRRLPLFLKGSCRRRRLRG